MRIQQGHIQDNRVGKWKSKQETKYKLHAHVQFYLFIYLLIWELWSPMDTITKIRNVPIISLLLP